VKYVIIAFLLLLPQCTYAQTYLGDGGGTSGLNGSCCNWTAQIDASGKACDANSLLDHPTCQVITKAQFNAFAAAARGSQKLTKAVSISVGVPILGSCTGGTLDPGSTDGQGSITFSGGSVATNCTLTFGSPPYNGVGCKVDLTVTTGRGVTTTPTGFTVALQGAIPNGKLVYFCPQ